MTHGRWPPLYFLGGANALYSSLQTRAPSPVVAGKLRQVRRGFTQGLTAGRCRAWRHTDNALGVWGDAVPHNLSLSCWNRRPGGSILVPCYSLWACLWLQINCSPHTSPKGLPRYLPDSGKALMPTLGPEADSKAPSSQLSAKPSMVLCAHKPST